MTTTPPSFDRSQFSTLFTPEQQKSMQERQRMLGYEHCLQLTREHDALKLQFQSAIDQGLDPADAQVRPLAEKMLALLDEFVGSDTSIRQTMKDATRGPVMQTFLDAEPAEARLMLYVFQAMKL